MKRIVLAIIVLVLTASIVMSQDYKKYWSEEITVVDLATKESVTKVTDSPVAIVLTKEKISVYAQIFQEYDIVSKGTIISNEKEYSVNWICVDQRGVRVSVTFGILYNTGTLLQIQYSDYRWTYKLRNVE